MIRSIFSKLSLPLALALTPLVVNGCGSDRNDGGEAVASTGTLSMPLVTTTNGHTYRLTGYIYLYGPVYRYLYTGSETELSTTLPSGDYTAYLSYYGLERLDDAGNYQPVEARLVSNYYQPFTIYDRTNTTVSFQFETDGLVITIGSGNLDINVDVTEIPPVCTILGGGCPIGTWCAPQELTGHPLACVSAGSVASGDPCNSPRDCKANTSCYDFGSGPLCTDLCTADAFDTTCPGGGSCTRVGSAYGVCVPDGETLPGGGGGEGGLGGGGTGG